MDAWTITLNMILAVHVVAAVMWVGALFFDQFFVARPVHGAAVGLPLTPLQTSTLTAQRWTSMATLVTGLGWLLTVKATRYGVGYFTSNAFHAAAVGGGIALLMVVNTWVVVLRNTKRAQVAAAAGEAPSVIAPCLRRIELASRINLIGTFTVIAFVVLGGSR